MTLSHMLSDVICDWQVQTRKFCNKRLLVKGFEAVQHVPTSWRSLSKWICRECHNVRSADWSRLTFLCHSGSRNHADKNMREAMSLWLIADVRALPVVLVDHNDELDYFTIRLCFFLVDSRPCLYILPCTRPARKDATANSGIRLLPPPTIF
jgi:hypothetical protein